MIVGSEEDVATNVVARLRIALAQRTGSQLFIEDAASSLGLSVHTLQRRLAEAGRITRPNTEY